MIQPGSILHCVATFLAMTFFVTGCEKSPLRSAKETGDSINTIMPNSAEHRTAIPIKTILTNSERKKLDSTIIGRNPGFVAVVRTSDGDRFQIPLSKLWKESQGFVERLPLISPTKKTFGSNWNRRP